MTGIIKEMINNVWRFQRGYKVEPGGRKNPDNFKHYRPWGFTIYRTYYGKESDEHWHSLLHSLRHQTKLAFGAFEKDKETDQDDRQLLKELFELDVYEDPSQLDGLGERGLREFCNAEISKATKVVQKAIHEITVSTRPVEKQGMSDYVYGFVLLADEAVLKDIEKGESIVKTVSLYWDGYAGWGWMRIPTGYLLEFWNFLAWHDDRLERCLKNEGTEEDLKNQIWAGCMACSCSGCYSEVRRWRHFESQDHMW